MIIVISFLQFVHTNISVQAYLSTFVIRDTFKPGLHVPSTSPLFVPFKNRSNDVLCFCLYVTFKGSKGPLSKTVTLTVRVNGPLLSLYNE